MPPPLTDIVGFPVSSLSFEQNADALVTAARQRSGGWIVTLNLEMVARAARDGAYRDILSAADYMVADGMPIVWLSRLKASRERIAGRTAGVDMVRHLLIHFEGPMGVLGGIAPREALAKLGVPPARVPYVEDGRVDPDHLEPVVAALRQTGCRLLFLALGVPKQDLVARALKAHCPDIVTLGVGGSFDVLAGHTSRAPEWAQTSGLEWLYRLAIEPRRLWRRYLLLYPRALPAITRWALGSKPPSLP